MAWRVDQVELIRVAIMRGIHHANSMRLDGDAALALEVHGVEDLLLHFASRERSSQFEQAVRQCRFAMVNMGNDGEIADVGGVHGVTANL